MPTNEIKILLVDDDADDRMLFEKAIADIELNTNLYLLSDGIHLMDFIADPNTSLPDIIFLDLNMPIMDGLQCLEELKANPQTKNVTVAIYSTSDSDKDVEKTFVNGANVYINKPFSYTDLKNVIKKVLTINWQYHNSALNKDNFLLKL